MTCTERKRNGNCTEAADVNLEWLDQICVGWTVKVSRCFCQAHATDKAKALEQRGVFVSKTLQGVAA